MRKITFKLCLFVLVVLLYSFPSFANERWDDFVDYIDIIEMPYYDGDPITIEVRFAGVPDRDSVYLKVREDRILLPEDSFEVNPYEEWIDDQDRLICRFRYEAESGYWTAQAAWSYDGIWYESWKEEYDVRYDANGNYNDGGGGCTTGLSGLTMLALIPLWVSKRKPC